jgi:hypothetical protein
VSVSAPLARVLAAARPSFNARVSAARRAQPSFDEQAFAAMLRDQVDPIVVAAEAVAAERGGALVDAAYDMAITLVARGLAGPHARHGAVNRLWREVAPRLVPALVERPFPLLGSLTNATLRIAGTPGARVDDWLSRLAAIGPLATADTLLPAGQLIAWRSGMAHYRRGALEAAESLPDAVGLAALGMTGDWQRIRAACLADPWWSSDPAIADRGVTVGGFAGFGGPFRTPPLLRTGPQGFLVRSGERTLLLIADAQGAVLHPVPGEAFDAAEDRPCPLDQGGLRADDRTIPIDLPGEGLSTAVDVNSVAVASRFSHDIRVFPWRRA